MFSDRIQAGQLLAAKLKKYKKENGIVLAVPRGGVPVAYVVAKELDFPMEVILTKKIGHPVYKEYAIGAASLTDHFVIPHDNIPDEYIEAELLRVRKRLKEMYERFTGNQIPAKLEGKTVIIIDDGVATGNTILGTVHVLQKSNPSKIVIAVPVASRSAFEKLSEEVDEFISVLIPDQFYGVGGFYENFEQLTDEEVMHYLDMLRNMKKAG